MKKAFTPLLLALAVALLAGCSDSSGEVGSVRFAVSASQALASDIARVSVTSSAADIPAVTVDLAATNGVWGGIIGNIPAGSNRSFVAQAFDSSGTLRFEGSATGVTITANQATLVAITLQQLNPPPPFDNEAPFIDALVASSTSVAAGGSISLMAIAHDANPGDTLTYAWTATAGSFSTPSEAATSWTAPATAGIQSLTLTVTDSRGLASSAVLAISVAPGPEGDAELSICFNSFPVVAAVSASPTQLAVGQTTSVSASASDPDGDSLSYSWSASCDGTWANASSSSAQFTPSVLPGSACNNCRLTVAVSDGRGGQTTGTVALCVSDMTPANQFPPVIIRSYRSSDTASPGQVLTYEVVASDLEGSPLTFSWAFTGGTLGTPVSDATRSRVTWTAPACGPTPLSITAIVTNEFQLTTTRTFTVTGLPACEGRWASTGSMLEPRWGFTLTLLPNGKVLAAGGYNQETGTILATAELYDPASGTWSPTGSMPAERWLQTATLLPDGKVLVAGGFGENAGFISSALLYDPASGTWSPTGSMNQSHVEQTATLLPDGRVLAVGGSINPEAELYDPASGTWSPTGSMAAPCRYCSATLLPDGKVLVAAGQDPFFGVLATAELYDPASGTWSPTGSLAEARFAYSSALLPNGQVLVTGGGNDTSVFATSEVYDPASGIWSPTGAMAEARSFASSALLPDGRVVVAGGYGSIGGSGLVTSEVYDPASGTWSGTSSLLEPRARAPAVLLPNGKVLIVGGLFGFTSLATAELYTP
ncbi:branched-chain amino acid ABC transporter2C amino acid-binding protein [Corallococcus coralloides DSM 2259]|uniref:Branched-chain amino acid ABC transporter2C amino acid-binding protein n=1 Tax=Corallococcus coralloides (strain ATCC 25202 / DSM 2259 / NBRC 100086 / M2) TaxID=1144275 RepID=H8MJ34_CORCM|nr:kelch repeat-containing protein [Corallococcus coralloides]AFE04501.1 branched-chain amino acid ABC transporter2C amino acid-binding protein [Corallococcus coralloides DSM 2259]